jgi:hypothetical protein
MEEIGNDSGIVELRSLPDRLVVRKRFLNLFNGKSSIQE